MKANDLYQQITNQVLDLMDKHGTDWVKPWSSKSMNHNKFSKTLYSGFNNLATAYSAMKNGFESTEWGTYKQWTQNGYSLKGAKGTAIIFFTMVEREVDGDTERFPLAKTYYIFNGDQVVGYEPEPVEITEEFTVERMDHIVSNSKVNLTHGGGTACYIPSTDSIRMPNKSDFTGTDTSDSQECYYSTLLHELGHWTGHKDRLNRNLNNRFGNQAYAFEELVAELSAVFSCARLGITLEPRVDNAKYLNGWKSMLRDDAKAIQKACALAQKATDYILQYDQVKDKKVA
tara:strand:+ start:2535 stop:3398 length:864 start_codon:yes stop_codon:yes gene_type:complete